MTLGRPRLRRALGPAAGVLALAACAASPADGPPDANLVIAVSVTGRVERPEAAFVHPGDGRHRCIRPSRSFLMVSTGPPPPNVPPVLLVGAIVEFGPDFPVPGPGEPTRTEAWLPYGPQTRFSLEVFPLPGQEEDTGPVRLGRAFRITMSAGGALWERILAEDDPAADGAVTLDPDGLGGRFRLTGLARQIPHSRVPPEDSIAVTGRWRCPRP